MLTAGVTSARFAISPSASLAARGRSWFFVARDTVSFLGATGGKLGISNETVLGGGFFWERVNLSAGLSLAAYSLPLCGARLCGQVRGLAQAPACGSTSSARSRLRIGPRERERERADLKTCCCSRIVSAD